MKRITVFIILVAVTLVIITGVLSGSAQAGSLKENFNASLDKTAGGTGHKDISFLNKKNPAEVIGTIIRTILGLTGTIFLLLMIYGGYTWMLARGNEAEVEKAKSIIQNSIIGLAIVFCAFAITMFFNSLVPVN